MTGRAEPLLRVDDLRVAVTSGGATREAVRGVSFEVSPGEVFGIVGESGSGKSLTVNAIPGLLPSGTSLAGGRVWFKGEDLQAVSRHRLSELRGRDIAMVFQDSLTSLNPVLRIGEQVREPLELHGLAKRSAAEQRAEEGLRTMGIPDARRAAARYPHEFSGGMRQRAMIATALIASPSLIIADEPTTALDVTVQAQILDICRGLVRQSDVGLILISHDLGVMSELATTLAVMYAGRIVEVGAAQAVLTKPQHPYTMALLDSMPSRAGSANGLLNAIPGEPPALDARPSGCPFHPRCPFVEDRCRTEEPALLPVAGSQSACWVAQRAPLDRRPRSVGTITSLASAERPLSVEPLLRLAGIVKHYPLGGGLPFRARAEVHALDGVSLSLNPGETLGIVGESGCGKSTLARCILRLTEVDAGSIVFDGRDITHLRGEELRHVRRFMQPVFQDPYASLNPRARVADAVAEPLLAHGSSKQDARRRVDEVLELVSLGSRHGDRYPHELSGGQRQRVGIARALALDPKLLVADEPISALDVSIQAQILNLLRDLQRRLGLTLVFISHDIRLVRYMSTNIAVLNVGKVVEYGPAEAVATRPRHPYTQALLSAVPVVDAAAPAGPPHRARGRPAIADHAAQRLPVPDSVSPRAARVRRDRAAARAEPRAGLGLPLPDRGTMSEIPPQSRPNVFEIDLDAIASNVSEIRHFVGPGVRIFVAMKANAYGFGLVEVACVLQEAGVDTLCVADLADAARLREAGITLPILLYAGSFIDEGFVATVEDLGLWVTVTDLETAERYASLARSALGSFVKVDVGLERLGIPVRDAADAVRRVAAMPHLRLEGLYTHLHVPDDEASADGYVRWQLGRFDGLVREMRASGVVVPIAMAASTPVVPVAGSGGFDAIDVGRLVYGSLQTGRHATGPMQIRNAFAALRSRLVQVKSLARTEYLAQAPFPVRPGMRIGIAPMGYADGLESLNCGVALVRGHRVPLLGASSLEHTRLDLSDVPDAAVGDEVMFVGRQGDAVISPDEVLEHLNFAQPARMATAVRKSVARLYRGSSQP